MRRPEARQIFRARLKAASDTCTMRDLLLRAGWRWAVLAMILAASLLCLSLSYQAFFGLLDGRWPASATLAGTSVLSALGVKWLCQHRFELVEL
jgi:hypothetical protein